VLRTIGTSVLDFLLSVSIKERFEMIIALIDAWKQFENYAKTNGYNLKILGPYILCNEKGKKIKLISVRMSGCKMVVWEDSRGYYEMDLEWTNCGRMHA
jgi:hypothetical protein